MKIHYLSDRISDSKKITGNFTVMRERDSHIHYMEPDCLTTDPWAIVWNNHNISSCAVFDFR